MRDKNLRDVLVHLYKWHMLVINWAPKNKRVTIIIVISGIFNGKDVMQLQFVSIKKNTAYIMTYTSDADNFDRYLDTFKSIQKTFKY